MMDNLKQWHARRGPMARSSRTRLQPRTARVTGGPWEGAPQLASRFAAGVQSAMRRPSPHRHRGKSSSSRHDSEDVRNS
eukprot:5966643-Pyramimonas_sp.AAC.1